MAVNCDSGLLGLKVKNAGGAMTQASSFILTYADGHVDTLLLAIGKNDSLVCDLSNIHGSVAVTNDDFGLTGSADDCLQSYFGDLLGSVNLADHVPVPLFVTKVLLCTYTTNLRNLSAANLTTELLRTNEGLTLRYVFHNITGNLSATSPGPLCPDLNGSVSITSIVITTKINISGGDNPQVTLGETVATINGLAVNVDGTFGFIANYIVQWFSGSFADAMEGAIVTAIAYSVPSDLGSLVKVSASCAD